SLTIWPIFTSFLEMPVSWSSFGVHDEPEPVVPLDEPPVPLVPLDPPVDPPVAPPDVDPPVLPAPLVVPAPAVPPVDPPVVPARPGVLPRVVVAPASTFWLFFDDLLDRAATTPMPISAMTSATAMPAAAWRFSETQPTQPFCD